MKERKKSLLKNYWELAQTSMPKTLLDSVIWIYFSKLRICDKATQILRNHPHFLRVGFSNKIWRFRQILVAFSKKFNSFDINLILSEIKATQKRFLKDWQIGSRTIKCFKLIFLVVRINFWNIKRPQCSVNEFLKNWKSK